MFIECMLKQNTNIRNIFLMFIDCTPKTITVMNTEFTFGNIKQAKK